MARIIIPTALRQYADQLNEVEIVGGTVDEALGALTGSYPALRRQLYSEAGKLRNFVNIYLNDEDVRYLQKGDTPVANRDTISIIPAIAGGSPSLDLFATRPGAGPSGGNGTDQELSHDEIRRYSRHLIVPEVGLEGQKKLKASSVLLIGAGGLGAPMALYLAAAGVGRIGIVDFDVVDESNLQRQVIHGTSSVGKPKLESARARIADINPYVQVDEYKVALTSENALDILRPYDVIADGTDNFPTRYLVNDACVLLGKPNVYGSIFRFEGQASVFWAEQGPCYRCLYPEPPPPGLVPSCAEGGVLGILPGTIGTIQATETLKLLLGIGKPLVGRLLLYNALDMEFREMKLRKDPNCPVCGAHPTVTKLIDYQQFCGIDPQTERGETDRDITATELQARLQRGDNLVLLDVREQNEWSIAHLDGATLVPVNSITQRASELNTADEIVLYCKSGVRSARALNELRGLGFRKLWNLKGGINAWATDVDRTMPRY
ncbi:MAG TPA: molybdopterin-synthase adenylyltransferase MoeB [Chloroflexia bacterium]|nr:molybdopterin-synthase adenylyltransferase MoeB [Chloroflexia bacterium]